MWRCAVLLTIQSLALTLTCKYHGIRAIVFKFFSTWQSTHCLSCFNHWNDKVKEFVHVRDIFYWKYNSFFLSCALRNTVSWVLLWYLKFPLLCPVIHNILKHFLLHIWMPPISCKLYLLSERYGLSFLGCVLTIGGTYLFVAFGPNSHEKLKAENIVKHIVGWPVLLYLVRYFHSLKKKFRSMRLYKYFSLVFHLKIYCAYFPTKQLIKV